MVIHTHNSQRSGFSLVELIIVVAVIAMLVALMMVAIGPVLQRGEDLRVIAEIHAISDGVERFKIDFDEYPPTAGDREEIRTFLARNFPEHVPTDAELDQLAALTPAESLVFWLGGMPISDGVNARGYEGFAADKRDPFRSSPWGTWQSVATTQRRTQPYYRFDTRNLVDRGGNAGFWEYQPDGLDRPLVYFRHDHYSTARFDDPGGSIAVAYSSDHGGYASPGTYQIVASGSDRHFGVAAGVRNYPSGIGYSEFDADNLTNFSRTRLGDAQ